MPRKNNSKRTVPHRPFSPRGGNCDAKTRYGSEAEATKIKEYQELLTMGLELKVYHCNVAGCGGWHLTRSTDT